MRTSSDPIPMESLREEGDPAWLNKYTVETANQVLHETSAKLWGTPGGEPVVWLENPATLGYVTEDRTQAMTRHEMMALKAEFLEARDAVATFMGRRLAIVSGNKS